MEGFGVLIFLIIAILAALSRAKQMGTGAPRPRPGSTLPRTGQPYPRTPGDLPTPHRGERPPVLVAGSIPDETERADALVPDDLWAILTGERRGPVAQRPLETPHELTLPGQRPAAAAPERGSSSFEVVHRPAERPDRGAAADGGLVWWPPLEGSAPTVPPPLAPASSRPAAVAPSVTPALAGAPVTTPAPPVAIAAAAPAGSLPAWPARTRRRTPFAGPADLRRAFVAQLVLGPPKALE